MDVKGFKRMYTDINGCRQILRDVRLNQCLRAFGLGVKREDQTHHKHGDYVLGFAALISLAIFKFY